jgi:hypothetical protein
MVWRPELLAENDNREQSKGLIVSERENESGGPDYGGDRGGTSGGAEGGQAGAGGDDQGDDQGDEPVIGDKEGQAGNEGGRGATETERRG